MTNDECSSGETFSSSAILWIVIAVALGVLSVIGIGSAF
jgi:hypothetical protein